MSPGAALKLAGWIHNANFKSALLIRIQASGVFGVSRSLEGLRLGSASRSWLASDH